MARNRVIAGDHTGCQVMMVFGMPYISMGIGKSIDLDKNTVESYEVLDETHNKSAANIAARSLIGGFLLGPAGLAAGALSSRTKGAYTVAIQFKDGSKSLLEVEEKIYRAIVRCLF